SFTVPVTLCVVFHLVVAISVTWGLSIVYRVFFAPLDLRRKLEDVGYIHHDSSLTKEESVWDTQRRKKIGNAPPVFPNGWFKVANSNWIKKGQVKSIYLFGEHIALFRNKRGLLRALNAYCPHLGANMAAGGKVVNSDCLECPFHGWKFSGETGKLVDVPYAQKVPTFVSVKKWSCCEVDDMAYMWYHCDGGEPKWKIPSAETIHSLKYVGKTEHIINCHIQDIPENAADISHLDHLHKPVIGSDVEKTNESFLNNIIFHGIQADWKPPSDPNEPHRSTMSIKDSIYMSIFNFKIPLLVLEFEIDQIGPGAVHIHVRTPFFRGLMLQNVTPIEPFMQKLTHTFYCSTWVPVCIAKAFYLLETTQIERDILMWNNKTYFRKPILVKEESALAKHRRWYQQFYSENSPKVNQRGELVTPGKTKLEDW
uniref:cholesterol 7-desaturase n=1 Tax=Ciona savignyi TaxID=51511 RepID=H2ZBT3_CIOSA